MTPPKCTRLNFRKVGVTFEEKQKLLSDHEFLPTDYFIISKEDMLPENLLTVIQVFYMDNDTYIEYKQDPIPLGIYLFIYLFFIFYFFETLFLFF